jgi:RNA polymerase sigma-70 factor (ECF subfamily)
MATAPEPARLTSSARRELDPEALVRRARLGSVLAFEQLVRLYGPQLHRFLVVRLGGERDARDVLQETLVAAWQGLPALERPERFRSWLLGIAVHKATDAARRRRPVDELPDLPAHDDVELLELKRALAQLPARLREVLLLRHLLCLSEEETAELLGVRVGTVKSRASRARRALEELLR